jgi:hypothetical protein
MEYAEFALESLHIKEKSQVARKQAGNIISVKGGSNYGYD